MFLFGFVVGVLVGGAAVLAYTENREKIVEFFRRFTD